MKYTGLKHAVLEWAIACHIMLAFRVMALTNGSIILDIFIWIYIFALLGLYKSNSFTFHLDPGDSIDIKDDNTRIYGEKTGNGYQFGVENSR